MNGHQRQSTQISSEYFARFALKEEYHHLFIVISETKLRQNTFLRASTIEMIPESIVLIL